MKKTSQIDKIVSSSSCGLTAGSRDNILCKAIISYHKNTREILRSSRRMTGCRKTLLTTHHNLQANKGFTLVELAIVIIIIGLLVGGVMAGQSLIRQSEVQNAVKIVEGYKSAAYTYKTKFNALPGDDQRAYDWFGAACDATPSNCNGDGDGFISNNNSAFDNEHLRFWQHLVLSKIVNGNFRGTGNGGRWEVINGRALPKLPFKDTYLTARNRNDGGGYSGVIFDNYLAAGRVPASAGSVSTTDPFLYPEDAKNIDTKMDDGKPWSGFVFVYPNWFLPTYMPNCLTSASTNANNAEYLVTYDGIGCHLMFGW